MKKKQKKLLYFSIGIIVFFGIIIGATQILEQKIEEKLKVSLQEIFYPELDGFEMNLSFINHFPHPSICINDLSFSEVLDDTLRHVLRINNADFLVDIGELFKNNFEFKDAVIENASIKFFTNYQGNNVRVFRYRTDEEKAKKTPATVSFSSVSLKNVNIAAQNDYKQTAWSVTVADANLEGGFKDRILSLEGDIIGNFDSLKIKKSTFIRNKPIKLKTDVENNGNTRITTFRNTLVTYENANFLGNGTIKQAYPKGSILDLTLIGKDDFNTIMGLLPPETVIDLEQKNPDSKTNTLFRFQGLSGPKDNAKVDVNLDISNATLVTTDYPAQFEDLDLSIKFTNGENHTAATSSLLIEKFNGLLNQKPITLSGGIFNLLNPSIDMDFDINMDLKDFSQFFPIKGIKELGGDLTLKGNYKKPTPETSAQFRLDGGIALNNDNLKLETAGFDFTDLKGQIIIKDSLLNIKKLTGIFSDIPFTMKGEAKNIYRLFLKNAGQLRCKADIYADFANLNTILNTVITDKKKVTKGAHPLEFPEYLHGDLTLQTPRLFYKNITAKNVKSKILFRGKKLYVPKFEMDVLHGHLIVDAKLAPERRGNYSVNANLKASNINTKRLLVLYKNFGQSVMTAENIKGRLSATVEMEGVLDRQLDYLENEIAYHSKITLKDGELINFEPVTKAFSNFRKKARAHIFIDHAEGSIFYNSGKLIVPNLYFTSNLSDVKLFGSRNPSEEMDFYFNFSLSNLLFGPPKKKKKWWKKQDANKPGNTHIQIEGKPGHLNVKPVRKTTWDRMKKTTKRQYSVGKKKAFEP